MCEGFPAHESGSSAPSSLRNRTPKDEFCRLLSNLGIEVNCMRWHGEMRVTCPSCQSRPNGFPMPTTLLALDLSTAHGSIAVVRGDDVLFRSSFQSERSHNAQVFAPLREALGAAGDELTGFVIGNGPGSYTGVRIAIAAAQGIALSRDVWCVGWSSLSAPDVEAPGSYSIIGDARRQSFYLARVEEGRLLADLEIVSAEVARERCANDGEGWLTFDAKPPLGLTALSCAKPDAARLAKIVQGLSADELAGLIAQPLIPHYLAEAFITMPKRPVISSSPSFSTP
ncbi:MAG: tRNA ((37)-N6)-threonylcarbamoyltransferase complex dimerization subunit type 1 TsaB [Prosthecobacter sp.]|nr:tRNA ((37)-N6)-threonylcarbamoyltransferase complex dimerization subunit type 1 TsaB [Prosthecobacter sp.]